MSLDIRVIDEDDLGLFLQKLNKKAYNFAVLTMTDLANDLRNNVLKAMQSTAKGYRFYKRGRKSHGSSFPGFPPAVDTGNYVSGIRMERIPGGGHVFVTGVPYLDALEYGAKSKDGFVKMAARPVWEPQFKDLKAVKTVERRVSAFLGFGR